MTVRRVLIHGGMHKTGTSFVQNTLYENRDRLLAAGVLYPDSGLHHRSPRAGYRHLGLRMSIGQEGRLSYALAKLLVELDESTAEIAVLSYEGLVAPDVDLTILTDALAAYEPVVVLYLRNPLDYLESKYREWVRLNNYAGEIEHFAEEQRGFLEYDRLVEQAIRAVGEKRVVVRAIELVRDRQRLASEVLEASGLTTGSIDLTPSTIDNEAAANAYTLTKLMANKLYFSGEFDARRLVPDHEFDYGGNDGRLSDGDLFVRLGARSRRVYDDVLGSFGHDVSDVTSRWSQLPYDAPFFDPTVRAKVADHLRRVHDQDRADRQRAKQKRRRQVAALKGELADALEQRDDALKERDAAISERDRAVRGAALVRRELDATLSRRLKRLARTVIRRGAS